MPVDNRLVILPWAACDTLVFGVELPLLINLSKFLTSLLFGLDGNVDMADLVVHGGNKVDTGNFRDEFERLWALPCVTDEGCVSMIISKMFD